MRAPVSGSAITFTTRVVKGAGRGRAIGSPTINLNVRGVPSRLRQGIYACFAQWNRKTFPAALHFGLRPVFRAPVACELHIIDRSIRIAPDRVRVTIVKRLRAIRNFSSITLLQKQIEKDVQRARAILWVSALPKNVPQG